MSLDNAPPRRSKVTGGLAALACAACCAIPLLITAGILTGAGAIVLERALLTVAAGLAVVALGMWWLHRRRQARRTVAAGRHKLRLWGVRSGQGSNCSGRSRLVSSSQKVSAMTVSS